MVIRMSHSLRGNQIEHVDHAKTWLHEMIRPDLRQTWSGICLVMLLERI